MSSAETPPWAVCQVCGQTDHSYHQHLKEVEIPGFVGETVGHLREMERSGSRIDPLIVEIRGRAAREEGGQKAWALWLCTLLQELDEAAEAPEIAAEIEDYLMGYTG